MVLVTATRDKVINRLVVTAGVAADPSNPMVEEEIRTAYRELTGRFKLPRMVTADVTANAITDRYEAEVAGDTVHFVGYQQRILIPSVEYSWTDDTVHFAPGIVITDDEVWAWVTPAIDLTAADISTTCVHGPEWLEPACIWRASMLVLQRLSRPASSTGANQHGSMHQAITPGYNAILDSMQRKQDDWFEMMRMAIEQRLGLGDQPLIESRYAGIREIGGRKTNRLMAT